MPRPTNKNEWSSDGVVLFVQIVMRLALWGFTLCVIAVVVAWILGIEADPAPFKRYP